MRFLARKFEVLFKIDDITKITEDEITKFFTKMRKSEIAKKIGGGDYRAKVDVVISMNKIIVMRIEPRKDIY